MIVGFQVLRHRPARRRDLRQPQAARGSALPRARAWSCRRRREPEACSTGRGPHGSVGALVADPRSRLGRHSGVQRSATSIGEVVGVLRAGGRGAKSSSSTTDRRDGTAARGRRRPARPWSRHPYNKGNGAAVKTGIRRATGEYILIVDADGQHPPADALPARRRGSASTTWSSARAPPPRRRRRRAAPATRRSTGSPAT